MKYRIIIALFSLLCCACRENNSNGTASINALTAPWEHIEQASKGSTVHMMMWQGDPLINRYLSEWVIPEWKKRYDINLQIAPGQGTEIVKILLAEKEAARQTSALDLCWINGETFFQLRQIRAVSAGQDR